MFCRYCGNELKDDAKFCPKCGKPTKGEMREQAQKVKTKVEQTVQEAKETLQNTSPADIKNQVKESVSTARETIRQVDQKNILLYSIRQRITDTVTHPKEHKLLFGILAILLAVIIGLRAFVFTDERYLTKNSDKMVQATVNMIVGEQVEIDDVPLDGMLEAAYKGIAAVQKSNPGKFANFLSLPAGEKPDIRYELNDVTIKSKSAVVSYTLNSAYRGESESVVMNIIWKKDDKKGWVITDQEIVKKGQTMSFTNFMR